jgi:hypothetical protein
MRISVVAIALAFLAPAARAGTPHVDGAMEEGDQPDDAQRIDGATATASTTLCEKKPKLCHGADQLLDGKMDTAWCEGLPGDGQGATITITFAKPEKLDQLFIAPHFAKSFALAEQNNRLKTIELATDHGSEIADLEDVVAIVKKANGAKPFHSDDPDDTCGDETCMSRDERITMDLTGQWVELPHGATKTLTIKVQDVYRGTKYHDLCASELRLYRAK